MRLPDLFWVAFFMFGLLASPAVAQLQATYWYFGDSAGVRFTGDTLQALTDGGLRTSEGCAAMSSEDGRLLFYTNGVTVWDSTHAPMQNGDSLYGSISTVQSALIVPHPGNAYQYYIFTLDSFNNSCGLHYSVVDMRQNRGRGGIIEKNAPLYPGAEERMTGTAHPDENSYWVITHPLQTDSFFIYPIDSTGIGSRIIREAGPPHQYENNSSGYGAMRLSPDGKWLALSIGIKNRVELFAFSPQEAGLSYQFSFGISGAWPYGLEFSPSSDKLYISSATKITQLDMTLMPDSAAVVNSAYAVAQSPDGIEFSTMQLGLDGRIYIANHPVFDFFSTYYSSPWLDVIHFPGRDTSACLYGHQAVPLPKGGSTAGLPNFLTHYFRRPAITGQNICAGDTLKLGLSQYRGRDSVRWTLAAQDSVYSCNTPQVAKYFAQAGAVDVRCVLYGTTTDTLRRTLKVYALPRLGLGPDTAICAGDSLLLDALPAGYTTGQYPANTLRYVWGHTTHNQPKTHVLAPGNYHVKLWDGHGCHARDSLSLKVNPLPVFTLGPDTTLCENDSILLQGPPLAASYVWHDQSTAAARWAKTAGRYSLQIEDTNACQWADTLHMDMLPLPQFALPPDTTICDTATLAVGLPQGPWAYTWHDGFSQAHRQLADSGLYGVTAQNRCGLWTDSLRLALKFCGTVFVPDIITPNGDGKNDYFEIIGARSDNFEVHIHNRWGRQVYYSADYQNDWNAPGLPEGVYFYIIRAQSSGRIRKGVLHVYH